MAIRRPGAVLWTVVRGRGTAATLADLSSLTAGGFARIVAEVLRGLGYHFVYIQPRGADGGPGLVLARDPAGRRVLVACRADRVGRKVSAAELRAFAQRLADHPTAEGGMMVTTGSFAAGAWVHGLRYGIHLVDGSDLVRLLSSGPGFALAPSSRRRLEWTG